MRRLVLHRTRCLVLNSSCAVTSHGSLHFLHKAHRTASLLSHLVSLPSPSCTLHSIHRVLTIPRRDIDLITPMPRTSMRSRIDAQLARFQESEALYNQSPLPGVSVEPPSLYPPYSVVIASGKEEQGMIIYPRALAVFTITFRGILAKLRFDLPTGRTTPHHQIAVHNGDEEVVMLPYPQNADRTVYVDLTPLKGLTEDICITAIYGGNRHGEDQIIGVDIQANALPAPNPSIMTASSASTASTARTSPPRKVLNGPRPARRRPETTNLHTPSGSANAVPLVIFSATPPRTLMSPDPEAALARPLAPVQPVTLRTTHQRPDPPRGPSPDDSPVVSASDNSERREPLGATRVKRRTERYSPYGTRPVKRVIYTAVSAAADGLSLAGGLLRGWADSYLGDELATVPASERN
ncbi:hypothetical protein BD626DRAFT_506632 [Schizophyllum amplum]|uniref:Uncharacterized protein n=1 Tax=Schizophyllum amplum TaxID=97359 RepID=A0A550C4X2_9AGAR|nr:hypothetical protein BD626DRAFT_506632 [Auriculariopsis ampla]